MFLPGFVFLISPGSRFNRSLSSLRLSAIRRPAQNGLWCVTCPGGRLRCAPLEGAFRPSSFFLQQVFPVYPHSLSQRGFSVPRRARSTSPRFTHQQILAPAMRIIRHTPLGATTPGLMTRVTRFCLAIARNHRFERPWSPALHLYARLPDAHRQEITFGTT